MVQLLWEIIWHFFRKLNKNYHTIQQFHSLGIYLKELKARIQRLVI